MTSLPRMIWRSRSGDNARRLLEAIESMRPQLSADTRFHLRHETYNLDAETEIIEWLSDGRIDLFAFNDHMDGTVANLDKPQKRGRMVEVRPTRSDEARRRTIFVDMVLSRWVQRCGAACACRATSRSRTAR